MAALGPANQPRPGNASPPQARAERARRAAVMQELEQKAAFPPYFRVVVAGVARLIEFALLAVSGFAVAADLFSAHGGPNILQLLQIQAGAFVSCSLFQMLRCYTIRALRHPLLPTLKIWSALAALFIVMFAVGWIVGFDQPATRIWLFAEFCCAIVVLTSERLAFSIVVARLARAGKLERRAVVVGGGSEHAAELLRELAQADRSEVKIVGVFDDRSDDRSPGSLEGAPKLGNVDDLVDFARRARIDLVVFALPITAEKRLLEILRKLWVLPVDVRLAANSSRVRLRPRAYSYLGPAPMLDVLDKPLGDWDIVIKGLFDRLVGTIALALLSPVMLIAAGAIKLNSRGPILFKQLRYGFNNQLIAVYKFRTLNHDEADADAETLVTPDDSRVTRIGHFLRRTSIDELPQLINVVFQGDLSLVGPRPHALRAKAANHLYNEVVDNYYARHRVKPGITGWAQINGWRGVTDTEEKLQRRVEHDLFYIENWSMLLDLYILALTPLALIAGKNAI